MKILLVAPFLPFDGVGHAGGKLVHCLLRVLARRHQVYLVARHYPGEEQHLTGLRALTSGLEVVDAPGPVDGGSPRSVFATVQSYRRLAQAAARVAANGRFDLCQVEFTETGFFFRPPPGLPAALTCHDVIVKPALRRLDAAVGLRRPLARAQLLFSQAAEGRALSGYQTVFTLSEHDRALAAQLYPGTRLRVLHYPGGLGFQGRPRAEVQGRALFVGALGRPQNREAVRLLATRVWPLVRAQAPGAVLRVVGGGLPAQEQRELSAYPGVELAGFVSDLEREHQEASLFVAPLLTGGGIIVKLLDAMAAGVPVVTTAIGNEGIGAKPGVAVLLAERPEEFAREVVALLGDPARRAAQAAAARRHVEDRFSEKGLEAALEAAYGELAGAGLRRA